MAKGRRTVLPLPDGNPERLEGGYKNELWRDGDVVLRLTRATLESVEWEHRLLAALDLPEAVRPLGDPALCADRRVASRFPYVPGEQLDRDDPWQREHLARVVARIHRSRWDGGQRPGASSWLERDLVRNPWWDWEIVEKPAVLVDAYEEMLALVADPPPLAIGVVHGDVYRANIRVLDRRIVGVLDWEEARLDWLASELANAAWEVCKVGDGLDPRRADAFVTAYVEAGGPGEVDRLDELVRLRTVADLLYSLTSKARSDPYSQDYVDHLLRALA